MSTVLARFIQISDLHFKVSGPDDRRFIAGGREIARPASGFHVGNSYELCRALAAFINRQAASDPFGASTILITGDLTNRGSREEMDLVRRYLDGSVTFGGHFPIGLAPSLWRQFMVLGNHDHWDGAAWPSFPSAVTPKCGLLWPTATATVPLPAVNAGEPRRQIRFIAVDTDADASRVQRVMGLGSFCSQLEKLGRHPALRRPRPAGEIRVLCMHHALYFQRKAYLSILPESRARLRKFLIDHQISIILSGHIHETIFAHYRTPGPAGEWMTLESSAGTATRDTAAYRRWMESLGIACLNQLVVHTVEVSDGRLSWRAEDYHYRARAGFVPSRLRDDDPHAVRAIDLP